MNTIMKKLMLTAVMLMIINFIGVAQDPPDTVSASMQMYIDTSIVIASVNSPCVSTDSTFMEAQQLRAGGNNMVPALMGLSFNDLKWGSCNYAPFRLMANNAERLRITENGKLFVGIYTYENITTMALVHAKLSNFEPLSTKIMSLRLGDRTVTLLPGAVILNERYTATNDEIRRLAKEIIRHKNALAKTIKNNTI